MSHVAVSGIHNILICGRQSVSKTNMVVGQTTDNTNNNSTRCLVTVIIIIIIISSKTRKQLWPPVPVYSNLFCLKLFATPVSHCASINFIQPPSFWSSQFLSFFIFFPAWESLGQPRLFRALHITGPA